MIVADTNLVTYLLIEGPMTELARKVFMLAPDWCLPALWRSEFRNTMAGYLRATGLDLQEATRHTKDAEAQFGSRDVTVDSADVLELVAGSSCTAYDCEFVSAARSLGAPLVTSDRQVLAEFPDVAVSPEDFLDGRGAAAGGD